MCSICHLQCGYVQEAKRQLRAEFHEALEHHASYHGSHWHSGQRVHRLHMPHSQQRWSGRRRSIHHQHPFSRWTQWSKCDEECIRHRERYCKAKRKCGHTKHLEQSKCRHCTPALKWHELPPAQHFQGGERQAHSSNTPSIIINAAAAAASGHQAATQPYPIIDSAEIVHSKPPRLQQQPPNASSPVQEEEEDELDDLGELEELQQDDDLDDSSYHSDQGDFFVVKRHRKRQRQTQRQRKRQDYSSRSRPHYRQRNKQQKPKHDYIDDDFEDYLERKSFRPQQRSLGSTEAAVEGPEGDVFQYEDFDFEPENVYADSTESAEYRNASGTKERNTPDGLRHRRIYSKWSRWSKCSPKCTTRRYKKCRNTEHCGREVLREIAYCYTEGSFCQQWLHTQVNKSPWYETRPAPNFGNAMRRIHSEQDAAASAALAKNNVGVIMNGKGYRGPEYSPLKLQCGLARANHRSVYNMLKIIGGRPARKGGWPWQVAIVNRFKEAICGGTLIAPLWVLTAAHCVRKVLYVRLGEHNLEYEDGTEMQLRVLKSYKHPNYDKPTVDSDVALLRLPKAVNASTWIGYSCLPRPYQQLPKNLDCTVIGWGKRRYRDAGGTNILHQAEVPIIPMDNCRSVYKEITITKNMFCAGHRKGRIDTCAGDSGGPLLCRDTTKPNHPWTIFGITSFGDGCAKRNKFGIYAKVSNYVDWVWSVVNCNGNCKLQ
ncbi:hypothetical protein KR222_008324 [Zaprionus bogoriensis]|nr:hypothetical protein KR222_008324 [Zaprionus bogoriensis]